MATIARMIVAMGADPGGLRRGLNQGVNEIRQFARSAQQVAGKSNIFGNLNTPAKQAAHNAVVAMQQQFAQDMSDVREQLAQGLINEREFAEQGRQAGEKFNNAITSELARLGNLGQLT